MSDNNHNGNGASALVARPKVAVAEPVPQAPPSPGIWDGEPAEASVPLWHYFWILRRHRWKILAAIAVSVIAAIIISARLTPIYESTATIDIDRRIPSSVLGQDSAQASLNDADQFLATQVKLIESDSVLRPVAEKYHLRELENPDWARKGLAHTEAEDTPVILRRLSVTRPPNTYLLLISYRSKDKRLAADVANGIAQSYIEHTYDIRYRAAAGLSRFMEKQLEELKAKMERSSAALAQFERELNVISPEQKTNILSARLLQLNTEYTNAQADRVRKEAAWESIQSDSMAAAAVSTQGDALKKLTESYDEAQEKMADVRTRFGINHPEYKRAAASVAEAKQLLQSTKDNIRDRVNVEYREAVAREQMLQKAVAETKAEFDRMNANSFDYQTLKRGADADKQLYDELVRKIKEAGINASFQNSSIRIADEARPGLLPVFPNMTVNVLLAFLFSGLIAVGAALLSDMLDDTIRDPDHVARVLKTHVIGNLPAVKSWKRQLGPISMYGAAPRAGHGDQTLTNYEEAIRTLRNSILLADFDRHLRSVLLTSASPSEGKSTVAAHLAVTHAKQQRKTLLIDGDLRRPSVHRLFQISNRFGLSNVLLGGVDWRAGVVKGDGELQLDLLPAGPSSRRAPDLIGSRLAEILEEATSEYDLVILDAPPLLGFAEPLQMATAVDGVVIVARAGDTSRKALAAVMSTLRRLRADVVGIVLNEVHRELSSGYYYYYYRRYNRYYKQIAAD
jgi:polysaccharide biosynthesis transport protein